MPRWTPEQMHAIETSGSNIIVSAGAGSGKTAVLTERVITKLRNGVNINELLILTFTKAAAAEMKERIRKAIKKDETLHKQLELIDTAYITTFDSYALSVVKKYHYLINVSPNITIGNDNVFKLKKKQIIDEIFEQKYLEKDSEFIKFISDLCTKDDSEIRAYVLNLSEKLSLRIDKTDYLNNYITNFYNDTNINNLVNNYIYLLLNKISELAKSIEDISYYVDGKYYNSLIDSFSNLINAKNYEEIKSNLDIKIPMLPRGSDGEVKSQKEIISDNLKKIKELCNYDSTLDMKECILLTKPYVNSIINILKEYYKRIMDYKFEKDIYEFTDIAMMAIDILDKNPDVCDEIKYSLKEILVDEYQDTSDLQETFIKHIENNNVYMVGDIKQSIYRFRNANPYIFKNKYDNYSLGKDGIKIDLNKNFRSRNEVLTDINLLFDYIMDNDIGGAEYRDTHRMVFGNMSYEEQGKTDDNRHMNIIRYPYERGFQFTKEEIEAFIIAEDIKNKVNNNYLVFDKETSLLRKSTYSDYVILMDRTTNFELYKKIFEYLNIPLAIHKDESLTGETVSLVLKNLLCLIKCINDNEFGTLFKYHFTSVARSFLFRYDDNDIFNMFINNNFKMNDIYNISLAISKKLQYLTPLELINEVVTKFNFYENIVTIGNISSSLTQLDYYTKLSEEVMPLGYDSFKFIDYLAELIDNEYEMKYSVDLKDVDSVKMMTIHKSKGLEYPVCYFSGLYKPFNISDLKEHILYDNEYGIITPFFKEGLGEVITKRLLKERFIKEEISEKIRLFYVALTRARENMIFVLPTSDTMLEIKNLVDNNIRLSYRSFADIINSLNSKLDDYTKTIDLTSICLSKDYNIISNKEIDTKDYKNEPLEVKDINIQVKEQDSDSFSKKVHDYVSLEQQKNIDLGLTMHSILENMNFKAPNFDLITDTFYRTKVIDFYNKLGDIKDANIYQEYEFMYEENNVLYHGIIDLMLEYTDYIRIIDYKLKNVKDESYIKQLTGYKNYVEQTSGKRTTIELYSIIDETFEVIN